MLPGCYSGVTVVSEGTLPLHILHLCSTFPIILLLYFLYILVVFMKFHSTIKVLSCYFPDLFLVLFQYFYFDFFRIMASKIPTLCNPDFLHFGILFHILHPFYTFPLFVIHFYAFASIAQLSIVSNVIYLHMHSHLFCICTLESNIKNTIQSLHKRKGLA